MTGEEIFRELGKIDSQFILNAAPGVKLVKKRSYNNWLPFAACFISFALIIGLSYGISLRPLEKPMDITWGDSLLDGGYDEFTEPFRISELTQTQVYKDKQVSYSIYLIFSNEYVSNDAYYALIVTNADGDFEAGEEDVEFFKKSGIFAEEKNGSLYIFTTKSLFDDIRLDEEKRAEYLFVLANKNAYE
jgi:hypothetical protein